MEAVVMHWRPQKCLGCAYYPECQQPEGVCVEIQRMPTPHWSHDFAAAVEIYFRAVQLSGCDMNGNPKLTMLEFVMAHSDYEIDDEDGFMTVINELHFAFTASRG